MPLAPLDPEYLPGFLARWFPARMLEPILSVEGGWEYWIQIDFPAWLDVDTGQQYDVRREQPGPDGTRIDWVFNGISGGGPLTACELKAQSRTYTASSFTRAVAVDVAKLQLLSAPYQQRLMIAAVIDQAAYDGLIGDGFVDLGIEAYGSKLLMLSLGAPTMR